jgi:hypothetical protein
MSTKLPPTLEALFNIIGIRAKAREEKPKNPTDSLIESFIEQMSEIEAQADQAISKIAGITSVEGIAAKVVCDAISAKGHDAIVDAMLPADLAHPAATALYRLTEDEEWLKLGTFYTALFKLLKEAHDKVCPSRESAPPGSPSIFETRYGKKPVGLA